MDGVGIEKMGKLLISKRSLKKSGKASRLKLTDLRPSERTLQGLLKNSSPLTGEEDKGRGENVDESSLFTLP
jgi:hypothetical protein